MSENQQATSERRRPLTLSEKAARLHAENPGWTHSEVMRELGRRRRKRGMFGVLHVTNTDRRQFANVERPSVPKRFAWQDRKDLD